MLAGPGVQAVTLAGLGPTPGAKGRTYVNPSTHDALFYAFDLPGPAGGQDVPALVHRRRQAGRRRGSSPSIRAATPRCGSTAWPIVRQIQAWAVTVEPRGGVPQPTGAMVLKGAETAVADPLPETPNPLESLRARAEGRRARPRSCSPRGGTAGAGG